MRRLKAIVKCQLCGHEALVDGNEQDQTTIQDGEWPLEGSFLSVLYDAYHRCYDGRLGIVRMVGFSIVEEE